MYRKQLIEKLCLGLTLAWGIAVLLSSPVQAEQKQRDIAVAVDGQMVKLSTPPVTIANVNYVPLRGVLERLGVSIMWDQGTETLRAEKGAQKLEYTIGQSYAELNGQALFLSSPGLIRNGTVMVPLRFVSEAFGAEVKWDAGTRTIKITSDDKLLSSISAEPTGNTAANLMNNGYAVQQGEWIYGLENKENGYASDSSGGYLYKVNAAGGDVTLLLAEQARKLNIRDEWIYFLGSGGIYKIRTDGSGLTELVEGVYSRQLILMNNWLFYNTDDGIYRLQVDRVSALPIRVLKNSEIDQFTVSRGWVYYYGNPDAEHMDTLARVRINGTESVTYGKLDYEDITIHKDYIYVNYYVEEESKIKTGRIPAEGGPLEYLLTADGFNIAGDTLYYGLGSIIYRSELDGTGSRAVANLEHWGIPLRFVMLNDSLYYEKSVFDDNDQYASAVYAVNIARKTGRSLFGKVLPTEKKDTRHLYPYDDDEKVQLAERVARQIVDQTIRPEMTQREKIKALHDYVVANTAYDYDNYLKDTAPAISYTAYGVFVEHTAVCSGYALAMDVLLDLIEVENYTVSGMAGGEGHAWNLVVLDDGHYHLDATWDDPVPDTPGRVGYKYFMISDEQMAADHEFDMEGIEELLHRQDMPDETKITFE
ncbi:stalk domain-containing protein [Paenibacillus tengchongensis]|uniref:stalk domain-containing protein n=1 Tax=Paenibacillus tengchongensis TaxID=2608684 RepID=UPI00124D1372|nr:stalk domain-containing protein [Paenibacillus tengchongensis]